MIDGQIVLASSSPRRQQILRQIGIRFRVMASLVDEGAGRYSSVEAMVQGVAAAKAADVAARLAEGVVLGADTVVVCEGEVLGKPSSAREAAAMLASLSGRTHRVLSGLALRDASAGRELVDFETTVVHFRRLTQSEIDWYVGTGEPLDKAGAYGIQGKGAVLVTKIEGCFYNVVGLPIGLLYSMLGEFGLIVDR